MTAFGYLMVFGVVTGMALCALFVARFPAWVALLCILPTVLLQFGYYTYLATGSVLASPAGTLYEEALRVGKIGVYFVAFILGFAIAFAVVEIWRDRDRVG